MSLLLLLKPKFFDGTPPVEPEQGGHFGAYDPKAFKRYQEQLKRKYSYRKHEPQERIVVLAEDAAPTPEPVTPEVAPAVSFDGFNAVAELLAAQAEQALKADQVTAKLERLLEQYQEQQAQQAERAAIEQALAEQAALEEMTRYAEMLRLRKKRRTEEEALILALLKAH